MVNPLGFPELDILQACAEAVRRQQEVVPLLAAHLGVSPEGVWHLWALRRCKQSGEIPGTGWSYFFHGFECDLWHKDGRFLRVDFGPGGRLDTFTAWGILQFSLCSSSPWQEFPALVRLFARHHAPEKRLTGDFNAFCGHWDALEAAGCFDAADPALVDLERRCSTAEPGGITYVRLPPGMSDEEMADCSVAHRPILSPRALHLLAVTSPATARPSA